MMLKDFVFSGIVLFLLSSSVLAYVTTNPNEQVIIGGECTCDALFMPRSAFPEFMTYEDQYLLPDNHIYNFFVYTRNQTGLQLRPFTANEDLTGTTYDPNKPSFVLYHGFAESSFQLGLQLIKDEYLKKVDGNFIMVDWFLGSALWNNYPQTIANSQAAACQGAILVKNLIQQRGSNIKSFYFSGHSLGGQTCAVAAKKVQGFFNQSIPRISALDPGQMWYIQSSPDHHLHVGDADFIDVLHAGDAQTFTTQVYFAELTPAGDVDFYPDGGRTQSACPAAITLVNDIQVLCSHLAAPFLFASSINGPCNYTSCSCPSVPLANTTEADWDKCLQNCDPSTSSVMGYYSINYPGRGPQYLKISTTDPRCTSLFSDLKFNDILNMFNNIVINLTNLLGLYDPTLEVFSYIQDVIMDIVSQFWGRLLPLPLPIVGESPLNPALANLSL